MYCSKCGSEAGENAKFCTSCGSPLGARKKSMGKKWVAIAVGVVIVLILGIGIFGSSSNKIWYEDSDFSISGFSIKENGGMYTAEGTVKAREGVSSEVLTADVVVLDKDGNQIAKTAGLATDIPEGGKAEFYVYLFDGKDFLSKEQVDSIASYQIDNVGTVEDIQAASAAYAKEAEKAEAALKDKYPNE